MAGFYGGRAAEADDLEVAAAQAPPPLIDQRQVNHMERASQNTSSASDQDAIEEEGKVRDILASIERRSKPFMMNRETMYRLGFDVRVQIVRVIAALLML